MTLYRVIGFVFKSIREEKGMPQRIIAGDLGMTQANYSRKESGKAEFTFSEFMAACLVLGVSVDEVMDRFFVAMRDYVAAVSVEGAKNCQHCGPGEECPF